MQFEHIRYSIHVFTGILSCGCGGKGCHIIKIISIEPTVTVLMNVTSKAVSLMSVLSSKAILKAAHDFNISFKVSFILSQRSVVLREIVKRNRLVISTKCFFYRHAYLANIVKQFFINFPSPKNFPFSVIDSHNLKLSFVTSCESFL